MAQLVMNFIPDHQKADERNMKLSREGQLGELWKKTGLANVQEKPLVIDQAFSSFDDYWEPFLKGAGPGALTSCHSQTIVEEILSGACATVCSGTERTAHLPSKRRPGACGGKLPKVDKNSRAPFKVERPTKFEFLSISKQQGESA